MKSDENYHTESMFALGRIPHATREGREALEASATRWLRALELGKWPRALQHFENASYLQGNHLTRYYYSSEGFGYHNFGVHDSSRFDNLVAKVADNRLIRPVETVVSMLTQAQPVGRVEPNSDLPEDEDAADLSQIVLKLLWDKPLAMPRKLREVGMIACIAGTAIVEIEFGETDVPVEVPKTRVRTYHDELTDEDVEVQEPAGFTVEMQKDIMARVWTPFHVTPDPAATCEEDMAWVSRTSFEDVEWVKENFDKTEKGYYPQNVPNIAHDTAKQSVLYWWSKMQDVIETPQYFSQGGGLSPSTFNADGAPPNQCLFTVIDVKPTRAFPKGRTLILASNKLVYCGDARAHSEKYPWRWHPYAFFSWFKLPGKFWGVALLSEIVPLQKKINAIDALVHVNRQYMTIGQWMLPKHCKVPDGKPSGIPGEHTTYTSIPGMAEPSQAKHQALPGELMQERADLLQGIDFIAASGVTDMAVSKSAARSGVILDFLRKEKLRSKSVMLQEFEEFVEKIAQNILIEVQLGMEDEDPFLTQRIQVAARDHSSLALGSFTGASLRDHHNIKLDIASELVHSPEAREAKAMEAAQYFGPMLTAPEKEGIMKAIGMDRFIRNQESMSVKRARRMVSRIVQGQLEAAFPMPGVDHARSMVLVFQNEILSDRFNDHDPEIKGALVAIFDVYAKLAAAEAQKEFEMQMAVAQAGGKGGGQGKGGQGSGQGPQAG